MDPDKHIDTALSAHHIQLYSIMEQGKIQLTLSCRGTKSCSTELFLFYFRDIIHTVARNISRSLAHEPTDLNKIVLVL